MGACTGDPTVTTREFLHGDRWTMPQASGRDQKDALWGIYTRHYGLDAKQARPDDTNWTGAEIKSCCRLASLLDVPLVQAAQNVVPVAVTAGDKIEALRQWASAPRVPAAACSGRRLHARRDHRTCWQGYSLQYLGHNMSK